ncbi:Molybdenum import ATP-binding protein ModC 2, partial [Aspergillus fumigatus]
MAIAEVIPPGAANTADCRLPRKGVGRPMRVRFMPIDFNDIDPNRVAAILYGPKDDVDSLLAGFAQDLVRAGERIGGVVQRNLKDGAGCQIGMQAIDLMTGREISICQPLGSGAMACKLDSAGLAEAAVAVTRAIAADVDLVVVNKFSKQEAAKRKVNLKIADAQQKQENQIKAIRSFIAQNVDAIFLAPVVSTGWDAVLKEAKEAKIPVVLLDRDIDPSGKDLYLTAVTSDSVHEGA